MDNKIIYEKILKISIPDKNYIVFGCENKKYYFGKDPNNHIIFMVMSNSPEMSPVLQETKSLLFAFNKNCSFVIDNKEVSKTVHLLICKENDEQKVKTFIRLTKAFTSSDCGEGHEFFSKLFSSLSSLFCKNIAVSEFELQGLFCELYTIMFFYENNVDIAKYWQEKSKMKFDFYINSHKRIEVKSTTKVSRVHRFRHEQLLNELYDIKIVSILLQKSNTGISLKEVIGFIQVNFPSYYSLLLHIDSIVSVIGEDVLDEVRYDQTYLDNNLKFYDAINVPHFNQKTPSGVYNAEYDCSFEGIKDVTYMNIKEWIGEM